MTHTEEKFVDLMGQLTVDQTQKVLRFMKLLKNPDFVAEYKAAIPEDWDCLSVDALAVLMDALEAMMDKWEAVAGPTGGDMLTPVVKKKETIDAILSAATERKGLTVKQIEEIAAAHGDTVTWLAPAPGANISKECNT